MRVARSTNPFLAFWLYGILAIALTACASSWLGDAETPGQKAFKAAGRYGYIVRPAAEYARLASVKPDILDAIRRFDQVAFDAMTAAVDSYLAGSDDLSVHLVTASEALDTLSQVVLGGAVEIDSPGDLAARGVVITALGLRAGSVMREWRTQHIKPKLAAFAGQGRDPTAEELADIMTEVTALHRAIQAAGT